MNIVTGAFSFTGKYITQRLLARGEKVRTLTGHPGRPNPFGTQVAAVPYHFDNPQELVKNLTGAATLYNTYWVRFPYGDITYERAVENTETLIEAAREAGVRRIVHISITNPSEDSPFSYFRGKAGLEKAIRASGLSYAILRPAVIFGDEGILINNIAWLLRRFPVFGIPGSGDYKLQPIFIEDLADMAVEAGMKKDTIIMDAIGPETFTFNELVRLIAGAVGSRSMIVRMPPSLVLLVSQALRYIVGDVLLTKDEIRGLMADLLISGGPPSGRTKLSEWLVQNAHHVGTAYFSELKKHY